MASPIVAKVYSLLERASMHEASTHPVRYDSKGRAISSVTGKQVWRYASRPKQESLVDYKARLKRLNLTL